MRVESWVVKVGLMWYISVFYILIRYHGNPYRLSRPHVKILLGDDS